MPRLQGSSVALRRTECATSQTRQSLSAANVQGYAGLFSALIDSGIPGLDPSGARNLLGSANTALSSGGAHGQASQFFTHTIGAKLGLSPFETQAWYEGGMLATPKDMFGEGSAAARFGMEGSLSETTLLESTLSELRRQYGSDRNMLAHATANHLGLGINQAMGLLSVEPNRIGSIRERLEKAGIGLDRVNAQSITTLARVDRGRPEDLDAIASDLLGRTGDDALEREERERLRTAMEGGDTAQLQNVLTRLVATREQEQTQGKAIHDAKVALENLKTSVADKLVPLTQDMRAGILYMAGNGEKTGSEVLQQIAERESSIRAQRINSDYDQQIEEANKQYRAEITDASPDGAASLKNEPWYQDYMKGLRNGTLSDAEIADHKKRFAERARDNANKAGPAGARMREEIMADHESNIDRIEREREEALTAERARREAETSRIAAADRERYEFERRKQEIIDKSDGKPAVNATAIDAALAVQPEVNRPTTGEAPAPLVAHRCAELFDRAFGGRHSHAATSRSRIRMSWRVLCTRRGFERAVGTQMSCCSPSAALAGPTARKLPLIGSMSNRRQPSTPSIPCWRRQHARIWPIWNTAARDRRAPKISIATVAAKSGSMASNLAACSAVGSILARSCGQSICVGRRSITGSFSTQISCAASFVLVRLFIDKLLVRAPGRGRGFRTLTIRRGQGFSFLDALLFQPCVEVRPPPALCVAAQPDRGWKARVITAQVEKLPNTDAAVFGGLRYPLDLQFFHRTPPWCSPFADTCRYYDHDAPSCISSALNCSVIQTVIARFRRLMLESVSATCGFMRCSWSAPGRRRGAYEGGSRRSTVRTRRHHTHHTISARGSPSTGFHTGPTSRRQSHCAFTTFWPASSCWRARDAATVSNLSSLISCIHSIRTSAR